MKASSFQLVLLDRDGVINRDRPHSIRSISEFELLPNASQAIRLLNLARIPVAVVTNQALVGRGVIRELDLQNIHHHMQHLLEKNDAHLDKIFYCTDVEVEPHKRRKPAPGMLLEAMKEFNCLPNQTVMIGDALRDIQAAAAAGCHRVLVKTGKGTETLKDPSFTAYQPVNVYNNLHEAVLNLMIA